MTEQFNQYFANVCHNLAKTLQNNNEDPCKFMKHTPLHSFFTSPVTEEWVANFLPPFNKAFKKVREDLEGLHKCREFSQPKLFMIPCQA